MASGVRLPVVGDDPIAEQFGQRETTPLPAKKSTNRLPGRRGPLDGLVDQPQQLALVADVGDQLIEEVLGGFAPAACRLRS